MKRDDLEKLGLEKDVIDQIMAMHGKAVNDAKQAADTAKAEIDGLKAQIVEANKQIKAFEGMDIDGVKAAAADWEAKAKTAQEDAEKQIAQLKFDHALDGALAGAMARNPKAVKALLNAEELELLKDGTINGLEKQLETIKSENDFLFEDATPAPRVVTGSQPVPTNSDPFMAGLNRGAGIKQKD